MAIVPEHKRSVNVGYKFGAFEVIGVPFTLPDRSGKSQRMAVCQCECGEVRVIRLGNHQDRESCGCRRNSRLAERATTHGLSRSGASHKRLFRTWVGMKQRCYLPTLKAYPRYGGSGIQVCDEWRDDYQAFHDWAMANGYAGELTIDRIDAKGNYEPSNCRWVTRIQNTLNMLADKRRRKLLEVTA